VEEGDLVAGRAVVDRDLVQLGAGASREERRLDDLPDEGHVLALLKLAERRELAQREIAAGEVPEQVARSGQAELLQRRGRGADAAPQRLVEPGVGAHSTPTSSG